MKTLKKLFFILVVMFLGMFAFCFNVNAETDGGYTYIVSNGQATITEVDFSVSGDVFIPETLGGFPVTSIGNIVFRNRTDIESVVLPDTVVNLCNSVFYGCRNLIYIKLSDRLDCVGSLVFYGCTSLESALLPNSLKTVGTDMFSQCTNLREVTIGSNLHTIENGMFNACEALEIINGSINILKIGSNAFRGCKNLTNIKINPEISYIGDYAFADCNSLTELFFEDNLIYLGSGAFYNCNALNNIGSLEKLTKINSYVFYNCSSLKSINISAITSVGVYAFYNCSSLKTLDISKVITIDSYAFYNCTSIETVDMPYINSIGNYGFYGCKGLKYLRMPVSYMVKSSTVFEGCESIEKMVFAVGTGVMPEYNDRYDYLISSYQKYQPWTKSRKELTEIVFEEGITNVGSFAFYDCCELKNVVLSKEITKIGSYAFSYCSNLESITIFENVEKICDNAFINMPLLKSINVDESNLHYSSEDGVLFNKDKTELIRFPEDKKLDKYVIPDTVLTVKEHAFRYCSGLKNVTVSENVKTIGLYAFADSSLLRYVYFNAVRCDDMDRIFENCALKQLILGDKVTYIPDSPFGRCATLELLYIPSSIKFIGNYLFEPEDDMGEKLVVQTVIIEENARGIYNMAFYAKDVLYCGNEEQFEDVYYYYDPECYGEHVFFDAIIHYNYDENEPHIWKNEVIVKPTQKTYGRLHSVCSCGIEKTEEIPALYFEVQSFVEIDYINKYIYGLRPGSCSEILTMVDSSYSKEYIYTKNGFGTGTIVKIRKKYDWFHDAYTILIYGDVNGDGWYDGEDAFIVNLIVSGILNEDDIGKAAYKAADCNHDGVVNEEDVELLSLAGLKIKEVDQTNTNTNVVESTAYKEYIGLVEQNAEPLYQEPEIIDIYSQNNQQIDDIVQAYSIYDLVLMVFKVLFNLVKSVLKLQ